MPIEVTLLWYAALVAVLFPLARTFGQLVIAALAFAALDEVCHSLGPGRAPDLASFALNTCAVLAAAGLLFTQRKQRCAESSAP